MYILKIPGIESHPHRGGFFGEGITIGPNTQVADLIQNWESLKGVSSEGICLHIKIILLNSVTYIILTTIID